MNNEQLGQFLIDAEAQILDVPEVIAWADQVIERSDVPPIEVIDLSLMAKADPTDVEHALARIYTGPFTTAMIARCALKIASLASKDCLWDQANQRYWRLLMQERVKLPKDLRDLLYSFDMTWSYFSEGHASADEMDGALQNIVKCALGYSAENSRP